MKPPLIFFFLMLTSSGKSRVKTFCGTERKLTAVLILKAIAKVSGMLSGA